MGNFQEVFPIILYLFSNLNLISAFIHEKFFVYKLGAFKNCKETKYIMIMIIAVIYIIFHVVWYLINSSENPKVLSEKIHSSLFTNCPPPNKSKIASPLLQHWKRGRDTVYLCVFVCVFAATYSKKNRVAR